jgi:hypothetical protein
MRDVEIDMTNWRTTPNLRAPQVVTVVAHLTAPRYAPCAIAGASLAAWHDRRDNRYLVLCPTCHALITCRSLDALYMDIVWKRGQCCQGCRARIAFVRDPDLIGTVLDDWYKTGNFPQSSSWVKAIPPLQCNVWAKQILAGLEAATAPTMNVPSVSVVMRCG